VGIDPLLYGCGPDRHSVRARSQSLGLLASFCTIGRLYSALTGRSVDLSFGNPIATHTTGHCTHISLCYDGLISGIGKYGGVATTPVQVETSVSRLSVVRTGFWQLPIYLILAASAPLN
jgi:hypothetical protein